jgi:hypothetical protein
MPKALARFQTGDKVQIACYHPGCEKVNIPVTLGAESYLHPSFHGNGRFRWQHGAPAKSFFLKERTANCPNCKTLFATAIIVSRGLGKRPFVFGYDPAPA